MALKTSVIRRDIGVFVVSLAGSLDSHTYVDLEAKLKPLLAPATKALMFDLKELEYISSMGVSTLLKARRFMEGQGGSFLMVNVQPQINEVFKIIKALPNVPVFENMEEADRYFEEIQRKIREEQDRQKPF